LACSNLNIFWRKIDSFGESLAVCAQRSKASGALHVAWLAGSCS